MSPAIRPPSDRTEKAFLIVFRPDAAMAPARLAAMLARLKAMCRGRTELAFSTPDASVTGLVVRTIAPPRALMDAVHEHLTTADRGFVMVLELGPELAAIGNSAGWRHIQRMVAG